MTNERFENVWDALEGDPEIAKTLTIKSHLVLALEQWINEQGYTQKEAAAALEITQPRLNLMLRGNYEKFSIDALLKLAFRAGLDVNLQVSDLPEAA